MIGPTFSNDYQSFGGQTPDPTQDFLNRIQQSQGMAQPTQPVQPTKPPVQMGINAFANQVKAKYPVYNNIDNQTLVSKVLAKYPVYRDVVHTPTAGLQGIIQGTDPNLKGVSQSLSGNFVRSLPGAANDVLIKPEQKLLADAGTRIAQAGVSAAEPLMSPQMRQNVENNLQKPQHVLGVDVAPLGTGMGAVKKIGGQALNAVDAIGNVALGSSALEKGAAKVTTALGQRAQAKAIQSTTEAVNPELSGKKLTSAYKDVLTGKREINSGGLLKPQSIGTNTSTEQLGRRLADLKLGNNPAKNLNTLAKDMKTTGTKLDTLLENDKTPVVKQGLIDTLEEAKTTAPREYVKDPNQTYHSVIDFAKEKAANAKPTMKGLRIARNEFDFATRREFPSAFKDGYIDTKTPAGQAIKDARDTFNNYLYQTAENGSDIQKLVGREADLYKATDAIAPKAAKGEGATKLGKAIETVKKHPLGTAAAAYGADKIIKKTTGIGF